MKRKVFLIMAGLWMGLLGLTACAGSMDAPIGKRHEHDLSQAVSLRDISGITRS